MSLINQMLKDLETRHDAARGARPIFQDLQPVRPAARRGRPRGWGPLAIAGLALAAYVGWQQWPTGPASAPAPLPSAVTTAVPAALAALAPTPAMAAASAVNSRAPAAPPAVAEAHAPAARPVPAAKPRAAIAAESGPAKIEKIERPYTPEELAANAFREARAARSRGQATDAERRLRQLLSEFPWHVEARQLLVTLLLESSRQVEAEDVLERGVAAVPGEAGFPIQLARLRVAQGAEPQAVAVLERARAAGQTNAELTAFLAALYQRANRHADAAKAFEDALVQRPQEGRWWIGLGISREALRQEPQARDAYQRALASSGLGAPLTSYAEGRLQVLVSR